MPCLNTAQFDSLKLVVEGTAQLQRDKVNSASTSPVSVAYFINQGALRFRRLSTDDLSDEQLWDIYEFLMLEFAQIHNPSNPNERPAAARFDEKMTHLLQLMNGSKNPPNYAGLDNFGKVLPKFHHARGKMWHPIDVLLVTAVPVEYIAMLRHCIDFFLEAADPAQTRCFEPDGVHFAWAVGTVNKGAQRRKVGVLLCDRYGPVGAGSSVAKFLDRYAPKHVIVSGIAASLNDEKFPMGDLGWSESIRDISLAKYIQDDSATASVTVQTAPDWSRLPDAARERLLGGEKPYVAFSEHDRQVIVRGLLDEADRPLLRDCFASQEDASSIQELSRLSRERAEQIDVLSNATNFFAAESILEPIRLVAEQDKWQQRIRVGRPAGAERPQAKPVQTLSGSWLVRQHGMRSLLQRLFPEHWMLEMEGGGVAHACRDRGIAPVVLKSVCDYANPAKQKTWQRYCADVAGAFCRELAGALATGKRSARTGRGSCAA